MHEIIIVGSGASGVASALELVEHNIKPLILDVGYIAKKHIKNTKNLYNMRDEHSCEDFLIGKNFEYFAENKQVLPAKLKSPYFDFVTKPQEFFNIHQENYNAITSFAKGGLANAWGNGLMRFSKHEFSGLPISFDDLLPYYQKLEKEIGISGNNDDLIDFFGCLDTLQKPLRRSKKAQKIYAMYQKNKTNLNKRGIYMGAPRLGVSDNDYYAREKCTYDNLEFWQPNHKSLYTPNITLDKLINDGLVEYRGGFFVDTWENVGGVINVVAYDIHTKQKSVFKTKKLILAGGTLNTSRIVLKSRMDHKTKLNFFDNPAIQIPIFFPTMIGDVLERDCFGLSQLNLFYKSKILDSYAIGAILEITSPLRSEFFDKFPFGIRGSIDSIKYFLPAMMACQIFFPSDDTLGAKLSIDADGNILLQGSSGTIPKALVREAVATLRSIGLLTSESLANVVTHGNGIHYGGTIPMNHNPSSAYETSVNGELACDKNVFIVDGSVFGSIPATNYSLSLMANAMRIANFCAEQQ